MEAVAKDVVEVVVVRLVVVGEVLGLVEEGMLV